MCLHSLLKPIAICDSTARRKAETLQKSAKAAASLARSAKTSERKLITSKPFTRFIREPGSPARILVCHDISSSASR